MSDRASLESPRAKIRRAEVHLDTLREQVNAFLGGDPQPYSFTNHVESNVVTEAGREIVHVAHIHFHRPVDPDWGLLLGDFIQNLRSALDHLIWQLVILDGGTPSYVNQFPTASTVDRYLRPPQSGRPSMRDRRLKGVTEAHRAGIDAAQPYRAEGGLEMSPIYALAQLSNADKHRVIQAAFTGLGRPSDDDVSIEIYGPEEDGDGGIADLTQAVGRVEDGAEVLRLRYVTEPDAKVKVKAEIPIGIAFGEARVAGEALGDLFAYIRDFIEHHAVWFD